MSGTLRPPPSVIATWPVPNYIDPVTRGPAVIYLAVILSVLGTCIVSARIYSRLFITKAPGLDDILIALSLGFSIALSALIIIGYLTWDTGHHIWDIPITKGSGSRLNVWISEICYILASGCVKISVLLFYRRLSVTFSRTFMVATWVGICYNICYVVGLILALLLICMPLNSYWNSFDLVWLKTHEWSCGREDLSLPLSCVLSVIGDFYSALLPMLLIRTLDMPPKQKTALYLLFGLGFLVVAAGIVRTILFNLLINHDYDYTWVLWEAWIWTLVELNVAIMAASAPALKPFFRRFLIEPIAQSSMKNSKKKMVGSYPSAVTPSMNSSIRRDSKSPEDLEKGTKQEFIALDKINEDFDREMEENWQTKRYQLRASRDGKLVPIQVPADEEQSQTTAANAPSSHRSKRSDTDDRAISDIAQGVARLTTPIGAAEGQYDPIRSYRAEIEALPQLPFGAHQSPLARNPSHSYSSRRATSRDHAPLPISGLDRHSSKGSVKAARIRAQQLSQGRAGDFEFALPEPVRAQLKPQRKRAGSTTPVLEPESPVASEDDREHSDDYRGHRRNMSSNGSGETLHLPRMGYAL